MADGIHTPTVRNNLLTTPDLMPFGRHLPAAVLELGTRWYARKAAQPLAAMPRGSLRRPGGNLARNLCIAAAAHGNAVRDLSLAPALRAAQAILCGRIADVPDRRMRSDALILASAALALAGLPVHLATLSESMAARVHLRGAETLRLLGLDASALKDAADFDARIQAYGGNVTIASVARLAQDVLRERVGRTDWKNVQRSAVLRLAARPYEFVALLPHNPVAVVDDADLVMLDAPHPVRVAEDAEEEHGRQYADQAFAILVALERDRHYTIDMATGRVRLTDTGSRKVETFATLFGGAWLDPNWREETVFAAIIIRDLFDPQVDYAVDKGQVVMRRAIGRSEAVPSILDLISAKEGLSAPRKAMHFGDTRHLFRSYGWLGGAGVGLRHFSRDFRDCYGKHVTLGNSGAVAAEAKLYSDRDTLLLAANADLAFHRDPLLWAPLPSDAESLPQPLANCEVVAGEAIFAEQYEAATVFQIGAAQANWECRLRLQYPDAKIVAYASPTDGLFAVLDRNHPHLQTLARALDQDSYRMAQASHARAVAEKRQARFRSEKYFESILSFVGGNTW